MFLHFSSCQPINFGTHLHIFKISNSGYFVAALSTCLLKKYLLEEDSTPRPQSSFAGGNVKFPLDYFIYTANESLIGDEIAKC